MNSFLKGRKRFNVPGLCNLYIIMIYIWTARVYNYVMIIVWSYDNIHVDIHFKNVMKMLIHVQITRNCIVDNIPALFEK